MGSMVGAAVGASVGEPVGAGVGVAVGASVGLVVGGGAAVSKNGMTTLPTLLLMVKIRVSANGVATPPVAKVKLIVSPSPFA